MKNNHPVLLGASIVIIFMLPASLLAHNLSDANAQYVQGIASVAVLPFMYLGAKHMVTGYDHLLFLVGVIFFLYRPRDVILYVTLFTIGHSTTLLVGVLGNVSADAYLIDAIIGLSIVYKAFENIGGFQKVFGIAPDTRIAVFVFGLFHGFGLATRLQAFALSPDALVQNILSFNVGVEVGQIMALGMILVVLAAWRNSTSFERHAFLANSILMTSGFLLAGYQVTGYLLQA